MNLEWFVRELANAGRSSAPEDFARLNRRASRLSPSADDPLFVPHLGGRISPSQPALRGSWVGLNWSHTAAHLYRAVLEGVALEYCIYRDVLQSLNPEMDIREVRITGGGEKSAIWNQLKADALGLPVVRINRQEGAPLGVALLAGYGVGLFNKLDVAAARWIRKGQRTRPVGKLAEHYRIRSTVIP